MNKHIQNRQTRKSKALALAVLDIALIIPFAVLGIYLLLDVGLGCVYKQKFCYALTQTADYLINLPPTYEDEKLSEQLLTDLCQKSGLLYHSLKIECRKISLEQREAIALKADIKFPLLEGSILPVSIDMTETVTAFVPTSRICAAIAISPHPYYVENNSCPALYIPIFKPFDGIPVWQFPIDTAIGNLQQKKGLPVQTVLPINKFFNGIHPSIY